MYLKTQGAWVAQRLSALGILASPSPTFLLNFLGLWSRLCKQWFPHFMQRFTVIYNEQMAGKKHELFSNLQDFVGPSGTLSLLEVGCGTRANFTFYPPGFRKFLIKSVAENRHLQFERFVVAAGENMSQVADGSMDVVVCTLVPCSVKSQEQMLQEVRRVLRPVSEEEVGETHLHCMLCRLDTCGLQASFH
uniref:Methyltransferase type 11 domain-containing protein n=1 Tax=Ailuropoda melanoleuca TaxID=9646 RepID=A0A7N5K1J8_AILME